MPSLRYAIALLSILVGLPVAAQDRIPIDLGTDWLRRDWDNCRENVTATQHNGEFVIQSKDAAALFWQVPTRTGHALYIDRNQDWIKRCDRPPRDFDDKIRKRPGAEATLISVVDYPYVSWRWRVNATIDDRNTANAKGEIRPEGDDFAAKLGISILNDRNDLREIAYVWTRTIPVGTVLTQKTTVIPWVLTYKWYRIVAESGDKKLNTWVPEMRNLYADFKRFYPNEEPREVVRVYLMSDSDNTDSAVTGAYSDFTFQKTPLSGYVNTDGKIPNPE